MARERESGIELVGNIPWGTHFGLLYKTKQDLIDILVPYFEAGLRNNEFCMWVTADPLNAGEARAHMAAAMPDLDDFFRKGQIEIIPHTEWYTVDGVFDGEHVLNGWIDKLREAQKRGFDGLRLTGNESWLGKDVWDRFIEYEQSINNAIGKYDMIAVCAYPRDKCGSNDVLDVASTHNFILSKRNGEWRLTEDRGQKEAREALRITEENYRAAFEQMAVGMTHVSHEGRFLRVNRKFCDITGYSENELARLSVEDITFKSDSAEESRLIGRLVSGEIDTFSIDKRYVRKDSGIVWVNLTVTPIVYNGTLNYLMGIAEDITERKQAEQALKSAEEFTRSTLDSLSSNIAVLDNSGKIVFANRQWMNYGRENGAGSMESIGVGANYFDVCRIPPGPDSCEASEALTGMLSVLNGEKDSFEMEYPCHSPDKPRWFMMRVSPINTVDLSGIIVVHTDITRRKLSEEALAEEKNRVELYNDLMGHDINNYNQVALGYLELIDDRLEDKELKELIAKPIDAIASSSHLIDDVRKLQKARSGEIKSRPVDLDNVLSELIVQYSGAPGKEVSIQYTGDHSCIVQADGLVRDVFSNLIRNAIKHSNEDSVHIRINLEKKHEEGQEYCLATIEDDGPGIPDAHKDRIFARFQRGNTRASGKGLGLYLVRTLVKAYEGRVWVEDRIAGDPAKGARFVVLLPAAGK